MTCPLCGSNGPHHQIARSEYPSSVPLALFGPIFALFFALARKRRFRCDRCGATFFSHTLNSGCFLSILLFFALLFAIAIVVASLQGLMHR
jgi:hypothetical protein